MKTFRIELQCVLGWLLGVMLLAGCGTPASAPNRHNFYVSALANSAWFIIQSNPDQRIVAAANHGNPLPEPQWAEFNADLARVPTGDRSQVQAEALTVALQHAP